MLNDRYVSVTRLTRYIKQLMESDGRLQDVWLKGEISNFKRHSRGHLYLTIKDQNARIRAVMFAGNAKNLDFEPEDGMKVLIRGSISLYEPYGEYQIYIREMEQDGLGRLFLAFEALKKKLESLGMFDPSQKKPLPDVPYEIGIVTSPTGAVIRDLFTTIKRRFPAARITVFPVLVQGADAAPSIAAAIRRANGMKNLEVLIVGRGGGSIEDLWAFNEEIVAEAIFQSRLPVISAVGHETDFTIADFVADKRAPTPTAAGEFVVPDRRELGRRIDDLSGRLQKSMNARLVRGMDRLKQIRQAYAFKYPGQLLLQKEQERDQATEHLRKAVTRLLGGKTDRLVMADRLLGNNQPAARLEHSRKLLQEHSGQLQKAFNRLFKEKSTDFDQIIRQLNALSPLKIMARGYNLAYNQHDQLIKSVREISPGDPLTIQMYDGKIDCQIWGIEEAKASERSK